MTRRTGKAWWWAAGLLAALLATLIVVVVERPLAAHRDVAARGEQATTPTVTTSVPPPVHRVAFIGDSWTFGVGATALRGYAVLTGEQLHWDYWVLGVGGSGYTLRGDGATYDERVQRAVETHPDVIVVDGSLNERASTPEALSAAADQTFADLRAAAGPHTRILVVGAPYNPGTPNASIDWINADIQSAAQSHGLMFVNPAAEDWVDPHDPTLWADPIHPNDAGHQLMADRLEPILRGLVSH